MNAYEAWSHPLLAAQVLRSRRDGHSEVALRVEAPLAARQVLRLEQAIRALPGVRRIAVDVPARRVRVVWDRERTSLPALLQAFAGMRCLARPLRHDSLDDSRAREAHDMLKRLLVAGMCAMQVMTYAFVIYIGAVDFVDFTTRGLFRWLSLATTAPVVFYAARPFTAGAWRELRAHRLGIHLPVALAVWLVFLASASATVRGSGEIYFDSVSMFVFLLLAARYVELKARQRNGSLGDAVIDATPLLAERRRDDGSLETVPALELLPGDRVRVAEGSIVPADGVLESAEASVDESLLSGESKPVVRRRGEPLVAGSLLIEGPAELRVRHSGNDTAVARLGALGARARAARDAAPVADDVELRRFIGRVLLFTLLTAAGWLLVDPSRAFESAVAVLVIACPCAFALTAPSAVIRAHAVLAQRGVLVTDSQAWLRLAEVDVAVFDKTGTLTEPHVDLAQARTYRDPDRARWLAAAATLARESGHPVARALARSLAHPPATPAIDEVRVTAGNGISARMDGRHLRLGRAGFVPAEAGPGDLWLADEAGPLVSFEVGETPRPDAARTLAALRGQGMTTLMASGDTTRRAQAIANMLGIDEWHAACRPDDKLALLQRQHDEGHVVLAVGDGANDAPVLAGADVSAALASGSELAQVHADILLLHGRLGGLLDARAVACQVREAIARGRRWSLAYNLCAVPFAALGWVPPWLAAIGMSASSLAVVLNALRIGRHAGTREPA